MKEMGQKGRRNEKVNSGRGKSFTCSQKQKYVAIALGVIGLLVIGLVAYFLAYHPETNEGKINFCKLGNLY